MALIRITWDRDVGTFMVETGEQAEHEDTEADEGVAHPRDADSKSRRDEITWTPKVQDGVESVVLVLCPDKRPIYVENLPPPWIDKLFKSEVFIESPQVFLGGSRPPQSPSPEGVEGFVAIPGSEKLNRVRKCLLMIEGEPAFSRAKTYLDCVDVEDEDDYVKVTPKKYLEEDWRPINKGLEEAFGKQGARWTTEGRKSHWKVL